MLNLAVNITILLAMTLGTVVLLGSFVALTKKLFISNTSTAR